ncbi:hypothetical protein KSF_049490 [Reticulibacter mediterranei]|uniref:Uncharacterized protein n=1 Tax=Reticulibacter mediterranei TaxID=2778369 RepID=A0A8J3IHY5_9CHLR|nr:hypothetical protein KSF_049490 [Reticulibacter mediterranei]
MSVKLGCFTEKEERTRTACVTLAASHIGRTTTHLSTRVAMLVAQLETGKGIAACPMLTDKEQPGSNPM